MNNLYKCLECKEEFVSKQGENALDGQKCPLCKGPLVYVRETFIKANVEEVRDKWNNPSVKKIRKRRGYLSQMLENKVSYFIYGFCAGVIVSSILVLIK